MPELEETAEASFDTADELREYARGKIEEALEAAYGAQVEYMKAGAAYGLAGANYALGQISASDYGGTVEAFVKAAETWTKKRHWADAADTLFRNSTAGLLAVQTWRQLGQIKEAERHVSGVIELLKLSMRFAEASLA